MVKKHTHKSDNIKKDSEDIEFDLTRFKGFFGSAKTRSIALITIALLISLSFAVWFRIQPAYLPITDDWAEDTIRSNLKNQMLAGINERSPNLPAEKKNELADAEVAKVFQEGTINTGSQSINLEDLTRQQSEFFKEEFRDESGQPYLLGLDEYYFYRLTKNYIDHGHVYEGEDDRGYYDALILAGTPTEERGRTWDKVSELHVVVTAWTYRIFHFFNRDISLMGAMFYVPLIIASLCVIPAFFIARKIGGDFGGFIAAIIMAVHPVFLSRTAAGLADTDAYNLFFPLFAAWFMLESIDAATRTKKIIFASLTGFALGLFSFAWNGWHFMMAFMLAAIGTYIAYHAIIWIKAPHQSKESKASVMDAGIILAVFFVSTAAFVTLFQSFASFMGIFASLAAFTKLKLVGDATIWPNVYTTVAELNPANLITTLGEMSFGSTIFLLVAFMGIILPLVPVKRKATDMAFIGGSMIWYIILISLRNQFINSQIIFAILLGIPAAMYLLYSAWNKIDVPVHYTALLLAWIAASIYASSKGIRFVMLTVPVFSVLVGISAGYIYRELSRIMNKHMDTHMNIAKAVVGGLLILLLFFPMNVFSQGYQIGRNQVPMMNDDWYMTLTNIRDKSQPDAIINSWWDFGHWFAAIGERAVTLDGGRQNNPQAHWLGKLMLTSDEDESVGILRYMDCGANTGYDKLIDANKSDALKSVKQIYSILKADNREDAKNILIQQGVDAITAEDVARRSYCSPPEDYFVTSQDMVGKAGVWAHFGGWDFDRASMFNKVSKMTEAEGISILMSDFGMDKAQAQNTYDEIKIADPDQWISPWPSFLNTGSCTDENDTIRCRNQVSMNTATPGIAVSYIYDLEVKDNKASVFVNIVAVDIQTGRIMQQMENKEMNPKVVAYIDDGIFTTIENDENIATTPGNRPAGFFIYQDPDSGRLLSGVSDYELASSIFTRLFFFENQDGGLKHFEQFYKTRDITGQKIIVWKINWSPHDAE